VGPARFPLDWSRATEELTQRQPLTLLRSGEGRAEAAAMLAVPSHDDCRVLNRTTSESPIAPVVCSSGCSVSPSALVIERNPSPPGG
jgi:hypothetical protein